MRFVTFIRGLQIEKCPMVNPDEYRYHAMQGAPPVMVPDGDLLITEATVETQVVPIHWLCQMRDGQRSDKYIAYSKEVQDLLEIPFDVYKEESERQRDRIGMLEHRLDKVESATLWRRLKFLFTGDRKVL